VFVIEFGKFNAIKTWHLFYYFLDISIKSKGSILTYIPVEYYSSVLSSFPPLLCPWLFSFLQSGAPLCLLGTYVFYSHSSFLRRAPYPLLPSFMNTHILIVYTLTHTLIVYTLTHSHTHILTHAHTHTLTYKYTHTHIQHILTHTHTYMQTHTYTHTQTHIQTHPHTLTYKHTHTDSHTYTQFLNVGFVQKRKYVFINGKVLLGARSN